jgi:hypothetical protein
LGHFKWGEFKAGLDEVMRATMREPFTDTKREEMAQRERWSTDPEHRSNEAFQLNGSHYRRPATSETGQKIFATEELKTKPRTLTQLKPRETDWATQEAVRKFQDPDAQGQSVH